MSAPAPEARPRLLALMVTGLALVLLLPWVSDVEWQGESAWAVAAVRGGRPFGSPERAGYLILGMAADAILPSSTARDMNLLGLGAGVLAALAVARLRSALARGGASTDRLLEPVAAALALLAAAPFLARAVAAHPAAAECFLVATAAALAWTGRLPAGLAVFGLLLFVSARSLLALPILIAAPRPRGDLGRGLPALLPWLIYAVALRLDFSAPAAPTPRYTWAGEGMALGVGMGGVAGLAALGACVGFLRGGPHRRFVVAAAAVLVLNAIFLAPRSGLLEASVPAAPWLAVLAGAGVGSLRRAAMRVRGAGLGPLGAGVGLLVLGLQVGVSIRHGAAPVWRRGARFAELGRALDASPLGLERPAGGWEEIHLFELATDFRRRPGVEEFGDHPLTAGERARLGAALARSGRLLLRRAYAVPLVQDSIGVEQLSARAAAWDLAPGLATFGGRFVLEGSDLDQSPDRRPGQLATLTLRWRAERDEAGAGAGGAGPALRVAVSVVDADGRVCQDLTHWLGHGLLDLGRARGQRFVEPVVFRLPPGIGPGDYGIEVAVYEPLAGEEAARDLDLGPLRQRRLAVRTTGLPPGVTPRSVRAVSFRLPLPAASRL